MRSAPAASVRRVRRRRVSVSEELGDPGPEWAAAHRLERVAGVDEAGRGPLAGPVYAAAVILDSAEVVSGLDDSKRLRPAQRESLAVAIRETALAVGIGRAEVQEIDDLNILQATKLAMARALEALERDAGGEVPFCQGLLIDGNQPLAIDLPQLTVVKGDQRCPAISAASILAKTARDAHMLELDRRYPGYGLARHKGYGTAAHLDALGRLGVSPIHRRSFAPVRVLLEAENG